MNDHDLMTVVRETFADVHSATAVERIVSRSRAVRARRSIAGMAAAVGATAAAAVAVSVALAASHQAASHQADSHLAGSHPAASHRAGGSTVQLAPWTVTRQAYGSIRVTFRAASHATELQRILRADGVPASVTFTGRQNPACQPYGASGSQAFWPFGATAGPLGSYAFIHHPKDAYSTPYALVIHPAALPSGSGLQIWTHGNPGAAGNFQLQVMLVRASPQCTGS
jgi:hypothetical protein